MRSPIPILGVVCATGWSCSRERNPTPASTFSSTTKTLPSATELSNRKGDAAALSASARQASSETDLGKTAEPNVSHLRAALLASDTRKFASLLTYPVQVNTGSLCTASIPNAKAFIANFNQIVRGKGETALRSTDPDYFATWQGITLGNGSVWFDAFGDGGVTLSVFNSDAWRIGAFPCDGEPEQAPPKWIAGTWRVTSVAILQGGQLIPKSPTTWIGKSIDIDMRTRKANVSLREGSARECSVGRHASRRFENAREMGASFAGLSLDKSSGFLDLECSEAGERYVERIDIIDKTALAVVGDDRYLLVLRREARTAAKSMGLLKPDEPCGQFNDQCSIGYVCTASRNGEGKLLESCREID